MQASESDEQKLDMKSAQIYSKKDSFIYLKTVKKTYEKHSFNN